ncbi:MAG: LacI family DNA-binding transcriptional regulator [Phycisphaeraceae bacterium]
MATIKQIAEECGVSMTTVSRVLNGKNKEVWSSTANRSKEIRRVAEKLQFRPNGLARAMRRGSFHSVTMIEPTGQWRSTRFTELFDGLQDRLAAADFHLVLERLPDTKLINEGFLPRILRESSSDGLLVNYDSKFPPEILTLIRKYRIPFVWINAKIDADCVYPDDFQSSYLATRRLLELGHRKIAYLNQMSLHYSRTDRRGGYVRAMAEAGLADRVVEVSVGEEDNRLALTKGLLTGEDRPTALVAYESYTITPALVAAATLGLRVPEDLSLVTFSTAPAWTAGVPITTCIVPFYEVGQAAADMLLAKIEQPEVTFPPKAIASTVTKGSTCVAPQP